MITSLPHQAPIHPSSHPPSHENNNSYISLIHTYLSLLCFDNAAFLAERYAAACKSNPQRHSHSLYLLALCHYKNRQPKRARSVLTNHAVTKESRYLLAKCCVDLELFAEAEECLLPNVRERPGRKKRVDFGGDGEDDEFVDWLISEPCPVPNGAAGLYLLGVLCRNTHRKRQAAEYFRLSLRLDPLMWTSFEALCEMGMEIKDVDPVEVFGVAPHALKEEEEKTEADVEEEEEAETDFHHGVSDGTPGLPVSSTPSNFATPFGKARAQQSHEMGGRGFGGSNSTPMFNTPNLTPIPPRSTEPRAQQTIRRAGTGGRNKFGHSSSQFKPSSLSGSVISSYKVMNRARKVASRLYYDTSPELTPLRITQVIGEQESIANSFRHCNLALDFTDQQTPNEPPPLLGREGGKALFQSTISHKQPKPREGCMLAHLPTTATAKTEQQTSKHRHQQHQQHHQQHSQPLENNTTTASGIQQILTLLCTIGAAYKQLCQYQCRAALSIFQSLPPNQYFTGWVQHQVGKAYFEMADYNNAKLTLQKMANLEPHRMKGLELLSTTLWHLKKEVQLSHLAQRAVEFDRQSPEAWCVVGNCFSLQKEHETALTFFRRSIQLSPSFTYSHTLSGHEYVSNEDFDRAASCYRNAIRTDERHYNAWYGLGAIYHRQEKYDLAEYHFRRALQINPQSSVLHCHLGMAQYASGKPYEALQTLEGAFRLHPQNPQARFQRANILISLERYEEALLDYEKVKDAAPREASVHFAMGKVCKLLGRKEVAMRCFLTALDLDPKDNNLIKAAMDRLDEGEGGGGGEFDL